MEPIAIIGMACRMPGAPSLEDFWELLRDGRHGIDLIPASRWDREHTFHSELRKPGKINTRHAGFITEIDFFDNEFFRISAEEAVQMDPQQRILLELTYEAVQDANLPLAELEGTETGVFVGVMSNDYLRRQTAAGYRHIDRYTGVGSGYCMIANRISYQLNLCGPSMAIDSACSSSLVSAFMACQSLWTHQCSLALAGGVNLILSPTLSVFYAQGGLSAADGKCRTLSDDATGMGRGEGAGVVVLKRLSDAVRDGDRVYAVIRGGAVNHNGRGNGMSAPNRWAQQSLLRKACEHAEIRPRDLDYVELHGTGTLIGDAIEATALGSVLAEDRREGQPCRIASVKTNLGHLEGAAGVAGLIKVALCLSHRELVASLWYSTLNRHVSFDTLPLKVQKHLQEWPEDGRPRLAGISSFGLGGANAHLVLQSAPEASPAQAPGISMKDYVLQLSARSEVALAQMAVQYSHLLEKLPDDEFAPLCHTTLARAQGHPHRATLVACSRAEMSGQLSRLISGTPSPNVFTGRYSELPKRKRIFIFPHAVFPHAGAIDFSLIQSLSQAHRCFKETLAECDRASQEVLLHPIGTRLAEWCERPATPETAALPFIHFGIQAALAVLCRTAGLEPDAVAGAGLGLAAAWLVAKAIDVKSAVARIAAARGLALTPAGSDCLAKIHPFLLGCYSPQGKNIAPERCDLSGSGESNHDLLAALPGLLPGKEADYFLQGVDAFSPEFVEGLEAQASVLALDDAQSFWTGLARLSVRHNIQWKNFVVPCRLVRCPRYPWQHSRFWLGNDGAEEAPATESAAEFPDDASPRAAIAAPKRAEASIADDTQSMQHATNQRSAVTSLDREKLLQLPEAERKTAIASYLKQQLAETLKLSFDEMDGPQTLTGLGIDSLGALQLKNRVEADLKMPVSLVKLLDGGSIGELVTDLLSEGRAVAASAGERRSPEPEDLPDAVVQPSQNGLSAGIGAMSAEEIDEMLHKLLANMPERSTSSIA